MAIIEPHTAQGAKSGETRNGGSQTDREGSRTQREPTRRDTQGSDQSCLIKDDAHLQGRGNLNVCPGMAGLLWSSIP